MTGADRLVEEARRARAEGDPGGAALSLLRALSLDPFHLGARAALAVLVDESEPPHALVDADREPEAALALAAFCAERQGDAEGALAALLTLLRHRPLSPFARWGEHLLSRQGDRCRPEQLVAFLGGRLAEPPGVIVDDAAGRRALEALGPLVTEADRWLRDDPRWSILVAAFLRKTGHADRALERALAVEQAVPGFDAAVATAMAYRARGELAGALAAYERARAHDPLDESAALDVADLLLEHHRFEAAGAAYRAILDEDPEHPGARAAALYVEAVLDPTPERTDRLLSLAADEPENERARRLATDLKARQTPFVGYLPRPRSALLDELSAETPRSGELVSLLPYLEAPSAVLAARLQLQALGHAPRLELGVAEIPARDPRMARRPVAYPLWDYDGVTARAAVARPHPSVTLLVAELASGCRPLSYLWQRAREVALDVEPRGEALLGVMTHPPPPLVGRAAWSWVQRMQVAAAFVIARLPGPWPGSFREEALTSLAWGVPDWSVEAGLCALARVAHAEAPAAVAVRDLFRELLSEVDPARPTCFDYGLVCNALFLPNLSQAERRRLLAQREALEQRAR